MIVLFGALADEVMAYVCARMAARDIDFLVLDARNYPHQFDVSWSIKNGQIEGTLSYGGRQAPLSAIRSVYVRHLGSPTTSRRSIVSGKEQETVKTERLLTLTAFADIVPTLVVNRPTASASNGSKPYQQQLIASHGFCTPKTLITTAPEEARRFYDQCAGRVVYKSISYQRSIVQRLTPDDFPRLEHVRECPTQFQEYIAGVEVRVHTVGNRFFATEILSDATDYRYAGQQGAIREMRAVDLPSDIAKRCLRLAKGLGLIFSGIDLRRSPEGQYYCLEVNPSPGFTFYQAATGQRIGDALIDLLCRGTTEEHFS